MANFYDDRNIPQTGGGMSHDDDALQAEINRRIAADPFLKDKDIHVVVYHHNVTLRGTLPTAMAADLLIDLVTGTPGVQEINKDLLAIGDETPPEKPEGTFASPPGRTVDVVIPADIPVTGEQAQVISDDAVNMMHALGEKPPVGENRPTDADKLAGQINEGMMVVDRDGKKVGKVKLVRTTDFRLDRGLLSHDYYVPYEECTFDGEKVVLKVLADEVSKQGWAIPGHSNDPYAGPLV